MTWTRNALELPLFGPDANDSVQRLPAAF